jgi:hypothetical protein
MAEYFRDAQHPDLPLFVDNIFRFIRVAAEVSGLMGQMLSRGSDIARFSVFIASWAFWRISPDSTLSLVIPELPSNVLESLGRRCRRPDLQK